VLAALPFLVPVGVIGVTALLFASGVLLGVGPAITPLILSGRSRSDMGIVQSLNWLAYTAGIALGASLGGVLLAAGDIPFVGLGALGFSWLAALVLLWRPSAGHTPATRSHPA
jgi:predicted MFS family arabinose efflux permease